MSDITAKKKASFGCPLLLYILHRLFAHITQNWCGRPLVNHDVIVNLIANTATQQGLIVQAELDTEIYPTGIKVSDAELALVNLIQDAFHGEWNYTIAPGRKGKLVNLS